MKTPITKRTALSLAVTASLACGFSNALADDYYCNSFDCTISSQIEGNVYLYSTDDPNQTETAPTKNDDLSLTLTGATVSAGSVYGAYAGNSSTITLKSFTLNITNSTVSGGNDIIGVNTADTASAVVTGDVTVNVSGSTLGDRLVGAYNQGGSLEVGNISISFTGEETDTGSIYGLGEESTAVTTKAGKVSLNLESLTESGNVFGFRSSDSSATSSVEEIEITITGGSDSGNIFGAYFYGCSGTSEIGNITINLSGGSDTGNVQGVYLYDFSGSAEFGDITITLSGEDKEWNGSGNGDAIYGYYGYSTGVDSDVTIGSVTVSISDSTGDDHEFVNGVTKQGAGTLTVKGDVSVSLTNMAEGRVQAVAIEGGTLNIEGNVFLYLEDIHEARAQYDNTMGIWVTGETTLNLSGNVDVVYIASGNNDPSTYRQDIFGVAYGAAVVQDGDVTVSLGGDAKNLGLGTHSIYGTLEYIDAGSESSYSIGGSRILSFGYQDTVFTSGLDDTFQASFSNFDEVVVRENSVLDLTAAQNAHLIGDQDFFNFGSDYEVWPNGTRVSAEVDYGPVESFANINGLWSRGGVLYLAEESGDIPASKLTLESGATANIMVVHNSGEIEIGDGATLTTYSCQTLLETSSAKTPAESVNSTTHEIDTSRYSDVAYESMNAGTITGTGTLVLESGDSVAGSDTSTPSAYAFANTGTIEISNFVLGDDAALDVQAGSVKVDTKADLTAASFLAVADGATAELNVPDEINAQISVLGKLSITSDLDDFAWTDTALDAAGVSASSNLLSVRTGVTTGSTGYISVGGGASVINDGQPWTSTIPGVYFGKDSTLVVDASILTVNGSDAAITGSGSAEVVDGAKVILYGSMSKGKYIILSGYDTDGVEGWYKPDEDTSSDQVYVVDTSGLTWSYYRGADADTVFIELTEHNSVTDAYPDLNIPNIANDQMNDCSSGGLVCSVLNDSSLSSDEKTKLLNSTAALSFAGGVMATSMTDVTAAIDSLHNHLTMDSDTFGKDGNLWPWDKSSNLWIDVLGSWQHSKHLDATGISNYRYRANSYGFILGYDYKLPNAPMVVGGAFSFSDGDLKSHGGVSKTKNEYQTYGVHLFSNYSPSSYYNIIGSLHWFHNSADIKQYASTGTAKAKVQTNLLAVGLRGETTIKAGQVNVVPHVEARYIYGKSGKYTTKLDGASLWNTKADGTHTVQFPVGVAARADVKTESGWNLRPLADVYVIPQVGNTKQKTTVRTTDGVSDTIDGQFMGKFGAGVKVGMQADKGNATVGLKYGFLGGTKGRADHSVILQGRYRF